MIKDIEVLNKHSQIRELGSELRYNILRELIRGAATCQQLAHIYGISKQKVHYNLNKLLEENLAMVINLPLSISLRYSKLMREGSFLTALPFLYCLNKFAEIGIISHKNGLFRTPILPLSLTYLILNQ